MYYEIKSPEKLCFSGLLHFFQTSNFKLQTSNFQLARRAN
jgi:hypothetical protein